MRTLQDVLQARSDEIVALNGQVAELREIIRELTRSLVSFTPDGSEYYRRWRDDLFYADTEMCEAAINDRMGRAPRKERS